jgi:hypothetical protein
VELNRPRRSLPADLPPELWGVIGLLCVAGLFTGIPVLRSLPDAFQLLTDGGLWDSFGPLVLVLLAELGFFAGVCFFLAWQLSQGDPVARVVTVVVAGSLAFGLLVGNGLDDGSATVTMLCSIAAVVGLTVPPRAREFFAGRPAGAAPTPVVAAEALVVMLSAIMLAVGVAYLPVLSVKAKYAAVGLALIGIAGVCFKSRRRLSTGDPAARTLVSGLMAGAVVAILVGGDGTLTGPLYIPLGVALAVVGLLWLVPESQAFFLAGGSMDVGGADADVDDAYDDVVDDRRYTDFADYVDHDPGGGFPTPSTPAGTPPPPPSAAASAARAPEAYRPSPFEPGPAPTASLPLPPPPTSRPAPPLPPQAVGVPVPVAPRPAPAPSALPSFPSPSSSALAPERAGARPSATPRPAAAPPRWLLEAPPAGFWPAERRRADPRRFEIIQLGPTAPDELQVAPDLGIRFDTTSWFPVLEGREQVRGAYLVSMAMFGDGPTGTAFRGTSTLLVTSARLVGVCAKGESSAGVLDSSGGRVAVWRVLLDQIDWVRPEGSAEGGHLALKGWDSERPWALLAKPRVAVEGAFQPSPLADLAELVNRAKHTSA